MHTPLNNHMPSNGPDTSIGDPLDTDDEFLESLPEAQPHNTLERLRDLNVSRMHRWHDPSTEPWIGSDWSNAMCGEAGEAANVVKKIRRHETGMGATYNTPGRDALQSALGEELADVVIYADLLAHHYGIDLAHAVIDKFDRVSEAQGFPERLRRGTARDGVA